MLLLVTNCRDITMDYVVAELRRRGQPFFRLNTEQLPQALCSMAGFPRDAWSISLDGVVVRGAAITGAYFRRPGAPVVPDTATDPGERAYIEAEWSSFLKSLYSRLEGRWLNSPTKIFMAEDKPMQLLLAQEIGFHVPQAFVTNDILCARAISALGQAIGKPLRQAVLAGEAERVIFTSRLAEIEDEQAEAIRLTPFIVQSEISKQYDVRVTVVGERVFATAIWSQDNEETITDWRKGSRPDLRHEKIVLDRRVERQCVKLVQRLGLRYGAIDLVCDQSGKLWFLEINPNGQWAWIENLTGYPIAAAIVDELTVNAIAQT
ncbi:hypothetical protein [Pseudomonas simiae]|jgi:glutathione synthase/RimK-type ligase-like ATP-grasp enzyme|uniref:hypothetical protein n=1 Tax=Pseudomonas simiae TaxID=321846 RepID=UPI002733B157|nr:hypothetical protein [Pseudomonas simiae]WLG76535.1 hypothetical protein PSH60_12625 [Pseudomonas simiae]